MEAHYTGSDHGTDGKRLRRGRHYASHRHRHESRQTLSETLHVRSGRGLAARPITANAHHAARTEDGRARCLRAPKLTGLARSCTGGPRQGPRGSPERRPASSQPGSAPSLAIGRHRRPAQAVALGCRSGKAEGQQTRPYWWVGAEAEVLAYTGLFGILPGSRAPICSQHVDGGIERRSDVAGICRAMKMPPSD